MTTSGIDVAVYPASIPVGKVRSVNESSGGLSIELEVQPMADIERLGVPHRAAVGASAVIPPSPLLVAIRTSLILVIALTIQLGMAPGFELFGVQCDLLLLVAICGGIAAGPDRGAAIGFAAGLTYDLFLQTPFGLSALTYAIVAYLVGGLQDSVLRAVVDPGADRDRGEHGRCHPVRRVRDRAGGGADRARPRAGGADPRPAQHHRGTLRRQGDALGHGLHQARPRPVVYR